jgi:hypothetical protein
MEKGVILSKINQIHKKQVSHFLTPVKFKGKRKRHDNKIGVTRDVTGKWRMGRRIRKGNRG